MAKVLSVYKTWGTNQRHWSEGSTAGRHGAGAAGGQGTYLTIYKEVTGFFHQYLILLLLQRSSPFKAQQPRNERVSSCDEDRQLVRRAVFPLRSAATPESET